MNNKMKNRDKERGFGLIGVMLSVVIVALLSVGIYSYFSSGSAQAKAYTEAQFASALASGVNSLYPNGKYTGISTQVAVDAKLMSEDRVSGASPSSTILSTLGGTVSVSTATTNNTDDTLVLTYSAVPKASCTQFVQNVAGAFDIIDITPTGGTLVNVKTPGTPLDIATVAGATACGGATTAVIDLKKI